MLKFRPETPILLTSGFSGTWTLETLWPGGRSTGTCRLTADAGRLSGSCGGDADQFPIAGTVEGRKMSWRVDVKQDGAQGRISSAASR